MSFLSRIFRKNKLRSPVDLSVLKVDMHSHILPGVDDGAPDVSTSLKMIRLLGDFGFQKLITTPHIMSDTFRNTTSDIISAKNDLQNRLEKEKIKTKLDVAAEYMLDEDLVNHTENNTLLTFGYNYILIEIPYFNEPPNLYEIIFQLQIKGYKVVLAHPERYIYWYNDFSKFEDLKARDVFFQLNLLSFAGMYSKPSKILAEKLSEKGMVNFLGSDLHNDQQAKMLEKSLYEPSLAHLVESGKLLNNLL